MYKNLRVPAQLTFFALSLSLWLCVSPATPPLLPFLFQASIRRGAREGRGRGREPEKERERETEREESLRNPWEQLGILEKSLGTPKESLAIPKESLGPPKESLRNPKESLRNP